MKCNGTIVTKNKNGKKILQKCNYQLSEYDIFCPKCGTPTNALSTKLSAKMNIKEVWYKYSPQKGKYFAFSIFMLFTAFLLIFLSYLLKEQVADLLHINVYFAENILYLFTIPLALIPFASKEDFIKNPLKISSFIKNLKYYPLMWFFVLINILYFFLLKVICTGYLLKMLVDPILHIVRFIMVLYWLVIVMPAPLLIVRKKVNPVSAIILSYKASAETRWQQFFILLYLFAINVIGLLLFVAGSIVTIPVAYILIEKYYFRMDEYHLFDKKEE